MQWEIELTADEQAVLSKAASAYERDHAQNERGWRKPSYLTALDLVTDWDKLVGAGLLETDEDCFARYRITPLGLQTLHTLQEPVHITPEYQHKPTQQLQVVFGAPLDVFMTIHEMLNAAGIEQDADLTERVRMALRRMERNEKRVLRWRSAARRYFRRLVFAGRTINLRGVFNQVDCEEGQS